MAMVKLLGGEAAEIKAYFEWQGGRPSGGTIASGLNAMSSDRQGQMADLFLLSPELLGAGERHPLEADPSGAMFDRDIESWVAPFVMSSINTRVVRRSCQLMHRPFDYQEYSKMSGPVSAYVAAGAGKLLQAALKSGSLRRLLEGISPAPGTGPAEAEMDSGWFRCHFFGRSKDGNTARAVLAGAGDPANRITVKCLCESALALACDTDRLPEGGGVLTPAMAMGDVLLDRLAQKGITFQPQQAAG